MRKYLIAVLLAAFVAVVYAAPAQADVAFCRDVARPPAKASCAATATEEHVEFASVRVGAKSKLRFGIDCAKGSHELHVSGKLRGTVKRVLRLPLGAEQWNECTADIRVRGTKLTDRFGRVVARGGIVLFGNQ
jgi:hypothetical protein